MELNDNKLCAICHSQDESKNFSTLPCSHLFHSDCIIEWFRLVESNGECPVCRDNPNNKKKNNSFQTTTQVYDFNNDYPSVISYNPPKNMSPYNTFMKNNIPIFKQQYPNKPHKDIFKLVSEAWKTSQENPKN
jgi:hypothetical protein